MILAVGSSLYVAAMYRKYIETINTATIKTIKRKRYMCLVSYITANRNIYKYSLCLASNMQLTYACSTGHNCSGMLKIDQSLLVKNSNHTCIIMIRLHIIHNYVINMCRIPPDATVSPYLQSVVDKIDF